MRLAKIFQNVFKICHYRLSKATGLFAGAIGNWKSVENAILKRAIMKNPELKNVKYIAQIENVKELRLFGSASLDFWKKQLANKPFQPFSKEGFAEIAVSATELVWMGVRFNELTVTLTIAGESDASAPTGVYLLHAFNSVRFFAFCERRFFSTPYYHGQIKFSESAPVLMEARSNNQRVFRATMGEMHEPAVEIDDFWEGRVMLPGDQNKRIKYFVAKLSGKAAVCPFVKNFDEMKLQTSARYPVFEWLMESDFEATEWRMRSNAFHAKSKTY